MNGLDTVAEVIKLLEDPKAYSAKIKELKTWQGQLAETIQKDQRVQMEISNAKRNLTLIEERVTLKEQALQEREQVVQELSANAARMVEDARQAALVSTQRSEAQDIRDQEIDKRERAVAKREHDFEAFLGNLRKA